MVKAQEKRQMDEMSHSLSVDLDAMTDEEVMSLIIAALDRLQPTQLIEAQKQIQARRQAREEEIKNDLMREFRQRALELGISFDSLLPAGRRTRSDAGQPLTAKYRSPQGETWTGRGRQPRWLTELEATGRHRDEFLIQE